MGNNCPDLATTKAVKSSSRLVYSVIQRSSVKLFGLKDAVAPPKVLPGEASLKQSSAPARPMSAKDVEPAAWATGRLLRLGRLEPAASALHRKRPGPHRHVKIPRSRRLRDSFSLPSTS